jgi:hypothetical protein
VNKIASLLFIVVLLSSCKEVSFREPQPRGRRALSSVPAKLQGRYLPYQDNGELSKDTIIITARGYRFAYYDEVPPANHRADYEEGILSDSLVLKSYHGYYFLNLFQKPHWSLRIIQQQRNGDLFYFTPEQEGVDFNDYIAKHGHEIPVDSLATDDETIYYIDPSPGKLLHLIEKGFFTRTPLKKIHQ